MAEYNECKQTFTKFFALRFFAQFLSKTCWDTWYFRYTMCSLGTRKFPKKEKRFLMKKRDSHNLNNEESLIMNFLYVWNLIVLGSVSLQVLSKDVDKNSHFDFTVCYKHQFSKMEHICLQENRCDKLQCSRRKNECKFPHSMCKSLRK